MKINTISFRVFFPLFSLFFFKVDTLKPENIDPQGSMAQRLTFQFSDPRAMMQFLQQGYILISTEIVQQLMMFQRETADSYLLQSAQFEFIFDEKSDIPSFSNVSVKAFTNNENLSFLHLFILEEIKIKGGHVVYLRFHLEEEDAPIKSSYQIHNILYDSKDNVIKRIILKSTRDSSFDTKDEFHKFLEGKLIEYKNFSDHGQPEAYEFKTFILDKNGKEITLAAKKSFNRKFNDQGFITQESTQETTYSYSGISVGEAYALYNVSYDLKGQLMSYEVVFSQKKETMAYSPPGNLAIHIERSEEGIEVRKMIREYRIIEGTKNYSIGKIEETTYESRYEAIHGGDSVELQNNEVMSIKEFLFDIKPGTTGLEEKDRTLKEALEIWNLAYDDQNQIILKRVLQTRFAYPDATGLQNTLCLFESLKNIQVIREKGLLKELMLDYYHYDEASNLKVVRKVRIEILEYMSSGDPAKIKLKLESPNDPLFHHEEIFIQDCNYIINEAILGKLFDLRSKHSFDVHIDKVSKDGEILDVRFYAFRHEGDKKIYIPELKSE